MNLILQAIKSLFRKLENKIDKDIVSNRSDWEQNDENGVGYVKNRPFYCKEDAQIDILPVGNYQTDDMDGAMIYVFEGQLIEGVSYIVTFNDIIETRLAVKDSKGKVALEASDNTDLTVRNYNSSEIEFFSWDSYGDKVYRLGLVGIIDEIKQIDEKYIPNSLIENIEKTQTMMANKMNANNPVGTGSFSMGREIDSNIGKNSHAEGYRTTASGECSHAEGYMTKAENDYSHAEGYRTTASKYSHAEGYFTAASQFYSHAEGNSTTASGSNSHAEGFDTIASGYIAHAEGEKNIASGRLSHAEGYRTTASGNGSHAEGYFTIAAANHQHVQGIYNLEDNLYRLDTKIRNDVVLDKTTTYKNIVFDPNSGAITVSESIGTISDSNISSHIGYYTLVENKYCKIIGVGASNGTNIYNRPFADIEEYTAVLGEYIHIVGNGTSDTSRSNAHTLDWEGNAWYSGDVYVGSTSGTNKDDGSKKLATEEFVTTSIENKQDKITDTLILADTITGEKYKIQIQNGQLVTSLIEEEA